VQFAMSVVGVTNAIDWVSSAWSAIQSQSGTGLPILDALTSDGSLPDGLSINAGAVLADTLAGIQINQMQGMGTIAGQMALDRISDQIQNKYSGLDITV
jgi:hypothetical protein